MHLVVGRPIQPDGSDDKNREVFAPVKGRLQWKLNRGCVEGLFLPVQIRPNLNGADELLIPERTGRGPT